MTEITLLDNHAGSDFFHIDARIENGSLMIVGHDSGPDIEKLYGEPEHDYYYSFTPERTRFLHYKLRSDYLSDDDLLTLVRKLFSGQTGERKLREYCHSRNIIFEFHDFEKVMD
ncbi:MAG: hypothetical protein PHC86_00345 [Eubacteriales bacterium]|nr:hypothetical protein [Eubacteriales bacterium]